MKSLICDIIKLFKVSFLCSASAFTSDLAPLLLPLAFLIHLAVVLLTLVAQCFLVEVVLIESFLFILVMGVGVPKERGTLAGDN